MAGVGLGLGGGLVVAYAEQGSFVQIAGGTGLITASLMLLGIGVWYGVAGKTVHVLSEDGEQLARWPRSPTFTF